MKILSLFLVAMTLTLSTKSQDLTLSAGTDIPYQHYIALGFETDKINASYRTGILLAPYSDAILGIIGQVGTDQVYIDLLDATFDFGWMNSIGASYRFGKRKNWYVGPELRIDYLTASDTPDNLIETVSGQPINRANIINRNVDLRLGLRTIALGLRLGRSFPISYSGQHFIRTEFSISKHIASQSVLEGNAINLDRINEELDRLLWEDVFSSYGYLGGLGISYMYKF